MQPGKAPQHGRRWYDLDAEIVRDTLQRSGPRLLHFVASVPDMGAAVASLQGVGVDRGAVLNVSRMTTRGLLEWRITVRTDGQRLLDGTLPTLIEWGAAHPAAAMGESGVTLHSLVARHPHAAQLRAATDAIGLESVQVREGPANLCATLDTPRGRVQLESEGL